MRSYLPGLFVSAILNCFVAGSCLAQNPAGQAKLPQAPKKKAMLDPADQERVLSVVFSPDGKTLASAGEDGTIKLWDVDAAKKTATLKGHRGAIWCVTFSPDGKTLASAGSRDQSIKLWDVETGKNTLTLEGHTDELFSVAFSPDGKTLASAGGDKVVKLWDVATGNTTGKFKSQKEGPITCVAFSPDGKTLASASSAIELWNIAAGKITDTYAVEKSKPYRVAFSPDGKILASADTDGFTRLWNPATSKNTMTLKVNAPFHEGKLYDVAFSKDGQMLAAVGLGDGLVSLWDVSSGKSIADYRGHPRPIYCVAFSKDGKTLATGGGEGAIKIWDLTPVK